MSEPTVEEVREALDRHTPGPGWSQDFNTLLAAARLWVDAAEPDTERWLCFSSGWESLELFHHIDAARDNPGVENNGHTELCGRYALIRRADR